MEAILIATLTGWEVLMILAVTLLLFCSRKLPDLNKAIHSGSSDEIATALGALLNEVPVWLAQGFGLGLIPVGPGTFGCLIGVAWFLVLMSFGSLWVYAGGIVAGALLSVWACGEAEKTLSQTDPGSVVLDEIVAVPFCFAAWVGSFYFNHALMPQPDHFIGPDTWLVTLGVFAAFRLFDVAKPWPVRQSQKLPGGWGVTADDLLAAVYVNAATLVAFSFPAIASKTVSIPSP
jgi:phosphatidylglycerophosphatase A